MSQLPTRVISMNKSYFPLILSTLLLTSCNTSFQRRNPNMAGQLGAKQNIENVEKRQSKNAEAKVEQIAVFAAGTDHALGKVVEPTREVEVAKQMNNRVISLSGTPTIDELKRVYAMVDDLTSQLQIEKERGTVEMNKRDTEITRLQNETKAILAQKDIEIQRYISASEKVAGELDAANAQLSQMNKWFGLGAVGYGLKKFVFSMAWIIGGFSIVFLVLRVLSNSNPAFKAIFSIFEVIASFIIRGFKSLTPGAFSFANFTPSPVANAYKKLSEKIVDTFETLKDRDDAAGQPKQYTLKEILSMFAERFGDDDKSLVDSIKARLGW
jgi:hypothetical protein